MSKVRVAVLTIYDQHANGARSIAAAASRSGHQVQMLLLKRFINRAVRRDDLETREWIDKCGSLPVYSVEAMHDIVCPFPTPITDAEWTILEEQLKNLSPEVIGISVNSVHLPLVHKLTAKVREWVPKTIVVWGGIHPTLDPETCIQTADAVCIGEGDESFPEFLADLNRTDVAGMWFRNGDGSIKRNPARPLIQNLDDLPDAQYGEGELLIENGTTFTYDQIGDAEKHNTIIISSHRGCPFACTYCAHGSLHEMYPNQKYMRRKSVDRFLQEIEHRRATVPMDAIFFWDDIFLITPKWMEEFCDKYPKQIGLPFSGYAHPYTSPRPVLEMAKAAGCAWVGLGIQTGSTYMSNEVYNRKTDPKDFVQLGRLLTETGLTQLIYEVLTNCEFEREEDCRATLEVLSAMPKPERLSILKIRMFPLSKIAHLQRPKAGLDPKIAHFYNMLYRLSAEPGFEQQALPAMADNPYLRAHPEVVESTVQHLAQGNDEKMRMARELEQLRDRNERLEQRMPWGVKRATRHLADQLANSVRRNASGN